MSKDLGNELLDEHVLPFKGKLRAKAFQIRTRCTSEGTQPGNTKSGGLYVDVVAPLLGPNMSLALLKLPVDISHLGADPGLLSGPGPPLTLPRILLCHLLSSALEGLTLRKSPAPSVMLCALLVDNADVTALGQAAIVSLLWDIALPGSPHSLFHPLLLSSTLQLQ